GGGGQGCGVQRRGRRGGGREATRKELAEATASERAPSADVGDVFPNIRVPVQMRFNGEQESFAASGIPRAAKGEGPFQSISYGGFFPNDSDATCMLSLDLAKRMMETDPGSLVGQTVTVLYM